MKDNSFSFKGQDFFIGIDVHKKIWSVTIRYQGMKLEDFKMDPIAEQLAVHINRKYPHGNFYSVYEAGFSGFWLHHKLIKLGIINIVVNAADIPTSNKEKSRKNDIIDSRKLAVELENGKLTPIYVQTLEEQTLKSLCRLRITLGNDLARIKNRISGFLNLFGCMIPNETKWSGGFISKLYDISDKLPNGETLRRMTDSLKSKKQEILEVTKDLKQAIIRDGKKDLLNLLLSVPGIGFLTAATLITEITEMQRFPNFDSLVSYVGLVPDIYSSGEKEKVKGLTNRKNKLLMKMLIEASWIAVRKDPAILKSFTELSKRMKKQKAIIRIAKKMLSRVRSVWINKQQYRICYN